MVKKIFKRKFLLIGLLIGFFLNLLQVIALIFSTNKHFYENLIPFLSVLSPLYVLSQTEAEKLFCYTILILRNYFLTINL
jgi:hypothetical protein